MLIGVLLGLWTTLLIARGTRTGATLQRWLVAVPARWLDRITRGHLLLWLLMLSVAVAIIWVMENDGRMLVTMGLPEIMGFATAIDLGTILDLAAVALVAGAAVRIRSASVWIVQRLGPRPRRRSAQRRHRPARPPAANDDEDRPALAA